MRNFNIWLNQNKSYISNFDINFYKAKVYKKIIFEYLLFYLSSKTFLNGLITTVEYSIDQ